MRKKTTPPAYVAPERAGLHWSVASRVVGTPQPPPKAPVAAQVAARRDTAPSEAAQTGAARNLKKTLAAIAAVVVVAIVVPVSLWSVDALAEGSEPAQPANAPAASQSAPPAAASSGTGSEATVPDKQLQADSTTTSLTPLGAANLSDPDALVWYSDIRFDFTMALPADWAEVPGSGLAGHDPANYHLVSFAEIEGPSHQSAFLNGIDVNILVGSQTEDPPQELVRQSLQQTLDQGPKSYDYFKVLKPIHEVMIGDVTAFAATVRLAWNDRVMVKSVYTFIANHCLYQVAFQADDAEWANYQALFEEVLGSFSFGADSG